jgi:isoamylase
MRDVIYEAHVGGFSKLNNNIAPKFRGKFLALCTPWSIKHFKALGVTTIQLMPIFDRKETYWGYDPISFMEHNPEYGNLSDMRYMLRVLHEAGFKVILDVVYNHTADNADIKGVTYTDYDYTGCGHAVDVPKSIDCIMESIDYWLDTLGFDGMRFDLANALCRDGKGNGYEPECEFLKRLSKYKDTKFFTAECYDLEQHSSFPEWMVDINCGLREQLRNGCNEVTVGNANPLAYCAYITCHDGLTLQDLTSVPEHQQHMIDTLHSFEGHILLRMGDEVRHTQGGHPNPYNIDNEITWINWEK